MPFDFLGSLGPHQRQEAQSKASFYVPEPVPRFKGVVRLNLTHGSASPSCQLSYVNAKNGAKFAVPDRWTLRAPTSPRDGCGWITQFGQRRAQNPCYVSTNVPVPIAVLKQAITEAMVLGLEAPIQNSICP